MIDLNESSRRIESEYAKRKVQCEGLVYFVHWGLRAMCVLCLLTKNERNNNLSGLREDSYSLNV